METFVKIKRFIVIHYGICIAKKKEKMKLNKTKKSNYDYALAIQK